MRHSANDERIGKETAQETLRLEITKNEHTTHLNNTTIAKLRKDNDIHVSQINNLLDSNGRMEGDIIALSSKISRHKNIKQSIIEFPTFFILQVLNKHDSTLTPIIKQVRNISEENDNIINYTNGDIFERGVCDDLSIIQGKLTNHDGDIYYGELYVYFECDMSYLYIFIRF